ncbi:hypothetical protein MKA27_12965 [[Clostridium] innocuum]|nr:hypothetical protein [[Clostridium] innocuum]MCR0369760.1 hypothetical protein [[Clostridium] innocuum]MCR0374729.1 hypothetical protein [[Clostridium] innocuum]MCR0559713.1 hypothetical protein [[Clostridium] innocuum]MCR0602593.1 hypothetical protein [[Clostridium] innocuum]
MKIINDSKNLNSESLLQTFNKDIIEVTPIRNRAIKGAKDIKKILYKDIYEKVKVIDHRNLSEADKKMLEKWKAINSLETKIKTILPEEYAKRLNRLQSQARNAYKSACLSENVAYMTNDQFKALMSQMQEYRQECDEIIDEITGNWKFVESDLRSRLQKLDVDINDTEIDNIIKSLPSADEFRRSYNNVFVYRTSSINKNDFVVDAGTAEVKNAEDYCKDNIQLFYYEILYYVYRKLDEKLSKLFIGTSKIIKSHAGIKQLAERLKKLDVFENKRIKDIKKRLIELYFLEDIDELSQKMEIICKDIIDIMLDYELCSLDDLDGSYMDKRKYVEMVETEKAFKEMMPEKDAVMAQYA